MAKVLRHVVFVVAANNLSRADVDHVRTVASTSGFTRPRYEGSATLVPEVRLCFGFSDDGSAEAKATEIGASYRNGTILASPRWFTGIVSSSEQLAIGQAIDNEFASRFRNDPSRQKNPFLVLIDNGGNEEPLRSWMDPDVIEAAIQQIEQSTYKWVTLGTSNDERHVRPNEMSHTDALGLAFKTSCLIVSGSTARSLVSTNPHPEAPSFTGLTYELARMFDGVSKPGIASARKMPTNTRFLAQRHELLNGGVIWPSEVEGLSALCRLSKNMMPFLKDCLDGLAKQNRPVPIQLVVQFDGTTAEAKDLEIERVLKEFKLRNPDIEISYGINGQALGAAATGNAALDRARYSAFVVVDPDDVQTEHATPMLVDALNENPHAGWALGRGPAWHPGPDGRHVLPAYLDDDFRPMPYVRPKSRSLKRGDSADLKMSTDDDAVIAGRTALFRAVGGFAAFHIDEDVQALTAMVNATAGVAIDAPLRHYRRHGSTQLTGATNTVGARRRHAGPLFGELLQRTHPSPVGYSFEPSSPQLIAPGVVINRSTSEATVVVNDGSTLHLHGCGTDIDISTKNSVTSVNVPLELSVTVMLGEGSRVSLRRAAQVSMQPNGSVFGQRGVNCEIYVNDDEGSEFRSTGEPFSLNSKDGKCRIKSLAVEKSSSGVVTSSEGYGIS